MLLELGGRGGPTAAAGLGPGRRSIAAFKPMKENVLGFSSRLNPLVRNSHWDDQRRNLYLIRPDIAVPLSVDLLVWPSLPDPSDGDSNEDSDETLSGGDFHDQALHLATNLARIKQLTRTTNNSGTSGMAKLICVTLLGEEVVAHDHWWAMAFAEAVAPDKIDPAWTFVGYDIADRYLTSGLSNCGYSLSEIERVRVEWKDEVNEFGLLKSVNPALRFREFTDKRVTQHAPFYIFGVYLID
jgi:hypothetical protein